jgi:Fe2+ transport system protein FeoA
LRSPCALARRLVELGIDPTASLTVDGVSLADISMAV